MKSLRFNPKLSVDVEVIDALKKYAKAATKNILVLLEVYQDKEDFSVCGCFVPKQEKSSYSSTIDKNYMDELNEAYGAVSDNGILGICETKEYGDVNIFTEYSANKHRDALGVDRYLVWAQVNYAGKIAFTFVDFENGVMYDDMDYTIYNTFRFTQEAANEEIKGMVEQIASTYGSSYGSGGTSYYTSNTTYTNSTLPNYKNYRGSKRVEDKDREKSSLVVQNKSIQFLTQELEGAANDKGRV